MNPVRSESSRPADVAWWREPTKAQWATFSAAWIGWVLDAFDFTVFLLVMPQIAREFGVSVTATTWSITLTLLVRLLGGVVAGAAADRWAAAAGLVPRSTRCSAPMSGQARSP